MREFITEMINDKKEKVWLESLVKAYTYKRGDRLFVRVGDVELAMSETMNIDSYGREKVKEHLGKNGWHSDYYYLGGARVYRYSKLAPI